MPVNDYTKRNMVSSTDILTGSDSRFLLTSSYEDYDFCHCRDGVYAASDGSLVEFYGRETCFGCAEYVRGLVYDADNVLKTGFGKDAVIIYDEK